MDAFRCIKTMRAVRQFTDAPIPDDVLQRILEAGRWSGSAKNTQPWNIVVVRDRTTLARLAECRQFAGHLRGAALGIAVVIEPTAMHGEFDAGRMAQNMELAAWADGVGSGSAAMYEEDKAKSILGVPVEITLRYVISFGYPAEAAPQIERKSLRSTLPSVGRKKLTLPSPSRRRSPGFFVSRPGAICRRAGQRLPCECRREAPRSLSPA
jgi:nitroreductase